MRETSAKMAFQWLKDQSPASHDEAKRVEFVQKWIMGLLKMLGSNTVLYLIEQINQGIKANNLGIKHVLDLLPLALQQLGEMGSVVIPGHLQPQSGSHCKEFYIEQLSKIQWDYKLILPLACALQDVSFTDKHLLDVVRKLIGGMEKVDQQELPPLVYQLLLFSKHGAKRAILEGIVHFLAHQRTEGEDQTSTLQLRTVQSTIILHMSMGLKSDQVLAAELLKIMKTTSLQNPLALKPLNMALLLSTVRVQRLGDQVIDLLRSLIVGSFKDAERLQNAPWIESTYQG
jgi:hypothetical protein